MNIRNKKKVVNIFYGSLSTICIMIANLSLVTHCQVLVYEPEIPKELKESLK